HPCANIMAFLPEPRTCTLFRSITCDISASHFKYGVGSISTRNQAEGDRGGRKGESASVTKSNAVNSFQIKSSRPPFKLARRASEPRQFKDLSTLPWSEMDLGSPLGVDD